MTFLATVAMAYLITRRAMRRLAQLWRLVLPILVSALAWVLAGAP